MSTQARHAGILKPMVDFISVLNKVLGEEVIVITAMASDGSPGHQVVNDFLCINDDCVMLPTLISYRSKMLTLFIGCDTQNVYVIYYWPWLRLRDSAQ